MLIINARVYLETQVLEDAFVEIENDKIKNYGLMKDAPKNVDTVIDAEGLHVLPGFIDQHIHGAAGVDAMDADLKGNLKMARFLPSEGTTSYLATTMTQAPEVIDRAVAAVADAMEKNQAGEAEILGVHLEGPFISPHHVGAQNPKFLLQPSKEHFDRFWESSRHTIKMITYAPEEAEEGFTQYLKSLGVMPSAGHTDASLEQIEALIPEGLLNLTHFHNAMTPHHHRNPGVVTAGFLHDELKVEMIMDGIHLHPSVIKTTYEIKGPEKMIAITDSMRAKGLEDGEYEFGGQTVSKRGSEARLPNGALAGSVAEMDFVLRNLKNYTSCSMHEIVKMSSENSAKQLNVFDRKGSIAIGKDADIVIVDEDINIHKTIARGQIAYEK